VGKLAEIKKVGDSLLCERIQEIVEEKIDNALKRGRYEAWFLPTVVSPEKASNFYIGKESPTPEEIYKFFYLLISGIYRDQYIVNLDNADEKVVSEFREDLIKEKKAIILSGGKEGINIKKVLNDLGIKVSPNLTEFIFTFIIVSYFVYWIKTSKKKEWSERWDEIGLDSTLETLGITDDTTLVIFSISKQKKEVYYVPKLKEFILKWYKKYLEDEEETPYIVKFIFSLYIADEQYRDLSASLLNKFLYYFLNGYVNGELLDKLVNLKIFYELRERGRKKIYGFSKANEFFREIKFNEQIL
jgi:hypothetical protein